MEVAPTPTEPLEEPTGDASVVVGYEDHDSFVLVPAGQDLSVRLPTDWESGYSWVVWSASSSLGEPIAMVSPNEFSEGAPDVTTLTWETSSMAPGRYFVLLGYDHQDSVHYELATDVFRITVVISR